MGLVHGLYSGCTVPRLKLFSHCQIQRLFPSALLPLHFVSFLLSHTVSRKQEHTTTGPLTTAEHNCFPATALYLEH